MGFLGEDFLIGFVFFIAAMFFLLVVMIIISFFLPEGKRHSSYISDKKKEIKGNTPMYKDFVPNKSHTSLEEGKEKVSNNQTLPPKLVVDEKNSVTNENLAATTSDSDLLKDSNENEADNPIQQSLNDDGTMRTEINFESPIENGSPMQFLQKYEYLETANNGRFRKLLPTDEKSFFRTWIENGTRLFEFYGNVDKALANINAIFDDVCEIEGKRNGASQIINKKPGVLDSNLSIEKKAIIKLL